MGDYYSWGFNGLGISLLDLYFSFSSCSTPIFTGDGEGGSGFAAAAAAAAAGGVSGFDFGVDPNLDPELALALRVSMEEERARQEAAAKKAAEDSSKQEKGGEEPSSSQDATMTERASAITSEAENKSIDFMVGVISFFLVLFLLIYLLINCGVGRAVDLTIKMYHVLLYGRAQEFLLIFSMGS